MWRGVSMLLFVAGCTSPEPAVRSWPVDPESGLRVAQLPPLAELEPWADNPWSAPKRDLGVLLFNDRRLSGSGSTNCSTCHFPPTHFQSNTPGDLPDRSAPGQAPVLARNSPSLLNLAYAPVFRWDGSLGDDLAEQMVLPFAEANMDIAGQRPADDVHHLDVEEAPRELHRRLTQALPGYLPLFESAFGVDLSVAEAGDTWRMAGQAMAVYMREVVSRDSAFDRWNAGDDDAISPSAVRGLELFIGEARCVLCHHGAAFTDYDFHNISTAVPDAAGQRADDGRFVVTGEPGDRGRFLTPTLRSAARTSPYFHDGSEIGLRAVIARHGESADPLHDVALRDFAPLSDDAIDDLVEFIKSLDGARLDASTAAIPAEFP